MGLIFYNLKKAQKTRIKFFACLKKLKTHEFDFCKLNKVKNMISGTYPICSETDKSKKFYRFRKEGRGSAVLEFHGHSGRASRKK